MKLELVGYAKTSKDTAIKHAPGWHRAAFADPLKRMASKMLEYASGHEVTASDWEIPEFKEQWRPMLVALGSGMRRTCPDFWIRQLHMDLVKRELSALDDIAITDCRYPNEVAWVLRQKGLVIRLYRPGFGPANDEEARSIEEIDRLYPNLPAIANEGLTPIELGLRVIELANEFRLKQMGVA